MKKRFEIFRYNPETDKKPYFKSYEVEVYEGMTLLDALNYIRWEIDGTLTYRRSCRSAICGSCAMKINGRTYLACKTQVIKDIKSDHIKVEPLPGYEIIKDLVVDMDNFFDKLKRTKPYHITHKAPPEKERLQSPEDFKFINEAADCILCGACVSACPSSWAGKDYLGPAALLKAYKFCADTRDEGADERLAIVNDKNGVWRCHYTANCMDACPKDIKITDYIARLRNMLVQNKL